ncbi:MAG: TonB-dependent receptor [Alphaproteobacteria bacterium]|nr:TonB-dependent receptor [Alphaproteobacteria bacterium]
MPQPFITRGLLAASALWPLLVTLAPAQSASIVTPADEAEQITVTATRRARALQDVPVAVTPLNEEQLRNAGVRDYKDLTALVPSLQVPVSENTSSVTARIRGIGTQGSNPGLESAVGVFVDGVYRSRNGVALTDLGELERVEVLRGPQGTLFGRNTSAGLINIITRAPEFEFAADAELDYGSYNETEFSGAITGPLLGDKAAGRLFAGYRRRDGWMDINPGTTDEREGNNKDYWTARGQLLLAPRDDLSIRFIADYTDRDEECCYAATVLLGLPGRAGGDTPQAVLNALTGGKGKATSPTLDSLDTYADGRFDQLVEDQGISGELNWELNGLTLTAITAFREWDFAFGQDADFTGADLFYDPSDGSQGQGFESLTQEVRLAGKTEMIDWLIGAFYLHENAYRNDNYTVGEDHESFLSLYRVGSSETALRDAYVANFGLTVETPVHDVGGGYTDYYDQSTESFALFTHNVFALADDLDLTLGMRWTTESKEFEADYNTRGASGCAQLESLYGYDPIPNVSASLRSLASLGCLPSHRRALDGLDHRQSRDESEWSGITTLHYEIDPALNLYATYSRGYKAGGFNLDRAYSDKDGSIVSGTVGSQTIRGPDTSFAPETVDAYELGAKATLMEGALRLNAALFYEDFENYQLNTYTGVSFIVTSVPGVTSKGVELEAIWRTPLDGLSLTAGTLYNEAVYDEDMPEFVAANPGLFLLPGKQLTSAPRWTATGSATYRFGLTAELDGLLYADTRFVSAHVTGSNLDPRKRQDAYALLNLRLGVSTKDESVSFELFGRNLTDEHYIQVAFDSPLQGSAPTPASPSGTSTIDAFVGEPLTIGAGLRLRF